MNTTAIWRCCFVVVIAVCSAYCGTENRDATETATASAQTSTIPHPPLPTVEEARQLIAASAEFSDYQFTNASWSLPMKRSAMNEVALASAKELVRAGWIRFDGDNVVLTAKAASDKRWLVRPNGFVDLVPLAKKELTEVAAVQASADGNARANFCWKWIPNEVGASFTSGLLSERFSSMQCASATLQPREGGGWEVLLLERRPTDPPRPAEAQN